MTIKKVTLLEVLEARDRRYRKQQELINSYQHTLVVLTLNIPGEQKNSTKISKVFDEAYQGIAAILEQEQIEIVFKERKDLSTGNEGYFVVKERARKVKFITMGLEDHHTRGRLFDIDVISNQMKCISRRELGVDRRKCFVCEKEAVICSRSKTHTREELQNALELLLNQM